MSDELGTDAMCGGEQGEQQTDETCMDATNGDAGMGAQNGSQETKKDLGDEDERKLFVGGLANGTTEDDLKKYFSSYGEVTKVDLKYDLETKKSRGFGFITFSTVDAITDVIKDGSHTIHGRSVDPKKAVARPKPPPMKKVFVGGVTADISEESIREHFLQYGTIEKIELPVDKDNNKRRAFCFICFETEEAAKKATKQCKQKISTMVKDCDIKLATPPPSKETGRFPFQAGGRFNQPGGGNMGGGRGRGRGGFQGQPWGNQYGGYNQGGYGGYNQGYQGYGSNYDYSGYGNYSGGYGNGYDNNYWNYGQGSYNQQQNSGYGKVKRGAGAGSQGYHPYSQ